jgi:hypothetical protein
MVIYIFNNRELCTMLSLKEIVNYQPPTFQPEESNTKIALIKAFKSRYEISLSQSIKMVEWLDKEVKIAKSS